MDPLKMHPDAANRAVNSQKNEMIGLHLLLSWAVATICTTTISSPFTHENQFSLAHRHRSAPLPRVHALDPLGPDGRAPARALERDGLAHAVEELDGRAHAPADHAAGVGARAHAPKEIENMRLRELFSINFRLT